MIHRMQHQHHKRTIVDDPRCKGNSVGNRPIDRICHRQRFANLVDKWILKMLQHHNQAPNLENHTITPKRHTTKALKFMTSFFGRAECASNFYKPDRLMNWKLNQVDTTVWNHVHRHNSKSPHNWPNHLICSIRIDVDIPRSAKIESTRVKRLCC